MTKGNGKGCFSPSILFGNLALAKVLGLPFSKGMVLRVFGFKVFEFKKMRGRGDTTTSPLR